MRIRTLHPGDRAEWLRMLVGLYPGEPVPELASRAEAFLSGADYAELLPAEVFVCERPEGGLAGFLELSVRNYAEGCASPTPHVESWYVDPDARGTGVGRALMAAAEAWAREHGFRELSSDAKLENRGSLGAHLALGFEVVERVVHFRKAL